MQLLLTHPGPWFNIKMTSYQYRKSHCGDKTIVRSSYLHNWISYTGKMTSLYWIGPMKRISKCLTWFHNSSWYTHNTIRHNEQDIKQMDIKYCQNKTLRSFNTENALFCLHVRQNLGHVLVHKDDVSGYCVCIIRIRRPWDRLIFLIGIPLLVIWHLYIGRIPCSTEIRLSERRVHLDNVFSSHRFTRLWHYDMDI